MLYGGRLPCATQRQTDRQSIDMRERKGRREGGREGMEKEGEAANAQCSGRVPTCPASESRPRFDSASRRFGGCAPRIPSRDSAARNQGRDSTNQGRDSTNQGRDLRRDSAPVRDGLAFTAFEKSRPQAGKAVQCARLNTV